MSTAPAFSPPRVGQDLRPGAGEEAQQRLAVLVAAVLAPHRAEHAQLDVVRLAVQQRDDLVVLGDGEGDEGQGLGVSGHLSILGPGRTRR